MGSFAFKVGSWILTAFGASAAAGKVLDAATNQGKTASDRELEVTVRDVGRSTLLLVVFAFLLGAAALSWWSRNARNLGAR